MARRSAKGTERLGDMEPPVAQRRICRKGGVVQLLHYPYKIPVKQGLIWGFDSL